MSNERVKLGRDDFRAHKAWRVGGRDGEGRISLVDSDLSRQRIGARRLEGARFERCSLDQVGLDSSSLNFIELVDCSCRESNFSGSVFDRGVIEGCSFTGSSLVRCRFRRAEISGGDWDRANCDRCGFEGATVRRVSFRATRLVSAPMDDATFDGCDFSGADFGINRHFPKRSTAKNARFVDCDFRGVSFEGRILSGTRFERCRFHGVKGSPVIAGEISIVDPDLSEAGDGSDIADADAVLALLSSK